MQKITVKISPDTLQAACVLWPLAIQSIPYTREQLKNKSIAQKVLEKLLKKQIERAGKEDDFNLKLEVHEAIVLNEITRPYLTNWGTTYQQVLLYRMIDNIDQKTA